MSQPSHTAPRAHDSWADAVAEARELDGVGPEGRYRVFEAACRLVFELLRDNPRREAILGYRDPLPRASEELLARARKVRPAND